MIRRLATVSLLGALLCPASARAEDPEPVTVRAHRLMQARRGRPASDIAAVADLLARVSRLAADLPEVVELDLNPVIVLPEGQGCQIVDVRIRVGVPDPA